MASPIAYSVLDLAPVVEGTDESIALRNAVDLAQHAESWGYRRYWLAEHHNMPGIASSATAVLIGHVAQQTKSIRVGSGGVMLPNHAPLIIAEQFGTLATLYPGRIDLGIGRAPGTDQYTAYAMRRNLQSDIDQFPRDVMELQHYLAPAKTGQKVRAFPGQGTRVPIWILGSSLYGAQLAAMIGLPYSFASHFAPQMLHEAIVEYQKRFAPSAQLKAPYLQLGFNVCAADTREEAAYLRTSGLQSLLKLRAGTPGRLPPPDADLESKLDPGQLHVVRSTRVASAVGTVSEVRDSMQNFVDSTGADELILVASIYEHKKRLRSFEIAAEAASAVVKADGNSAEHTKDADHSMSD